MARTPVMGAGGIVVRSDAPLIAVVRLRKRDHWVLPKGKLDSGESPREAAEREAVEETGHDVTVHEFVGTVAYEVRGGPKVVHFWRMEAAGGQVHELMRDIRAVAWLPLDAALARLTREHERAFLAEIGPRVLAAAAQDRRTAERRPPLVPDLPGPVPGPDASSSSGSGLAPSGGATVTAAEYLTADSVAVETPQGAIAGETMSRSRKPWLSRVWRWLSRGG